MLMTGLGRISRGSLSSNKKEWGSFLIEYGIEGAYFDKMKVSTIPNGKGGYCMYRQMWIGVGDSSKFKDVVTNPKTQFKYYEIPPRISKAVTLRELKYHIEYESSDEEIDESPTMAQQFINEFNAKEDELQTKSYNNLEEILQLMDKGLNTQTQTLDLIIASIQESKMEAQKQRIDLIETMFAGDVDARVSSNDYIINNEEEAQKKVPFMTQLGIPLTKNSISMLLKEINTLNRINEDTNLLQYMNWLGKPITMVSIPTSKSESTFLSHNKYYFNWLDSLRLQVG